MLMDCGGGAGDWAALEFVQVGRVDVEARGYPALNSLPLWHEPLIKKSCLLLFISVINHLLDV